MLFSAINQLKARPSAHADMSDGASMRVSRHYLPPGRRVVSVSCGGMGCFYWPPHIHAEHELFWDVRGGPMLVTTPGRMWVVPPGSGLWLPAGVAHEVHLGEATRFEATFIDASWLADWSEVRALVLPSLAGEIISFLSLGAMASDVRQRAERLLVDIVGARQGDGIDLPMPRDPRLLRVVQVMLGDLAADLPLEDWSAVAAMSPRNFTRRFRADTGMSFGDWRTLARMRLAATLLAAGEPASLVASRVGYATASAFVAAFRRVTGHTPGTLSAQGQDGPDATGFGRTGSPSGVRSLG